MTNCNKLKNKFNNKIRIQVVIQTYKKLKISFSKIEQKTFNFSLS